MKNAKKNGGKDSPFGQLKGLREQLKTEDEAKAEAARKAKAEALQRTASAREEQDLLAEAMRGVKPIDRPEEPRPRPKPKAPSGKSAIQEDHDEVLRELQGMLDGSIPLNFSYSDEFVEGRAMDCSQLELGRLKQGDFAVQGNLDLHGRNREEAREALEKFFAESIRLGHRMVLVISGRGLHTPGGKPVIKELLVKWLAQGRLSHYVLAFCSAQSHDGGVGALYVLLRRNPKRVV